jgi:hypothetical protein
MDEKNGNRPLPLGQRPAPFDLKKLETDTKSTPVATGVGHVEVV